MAAPDVGQGSVISYEERVEAMTAIIGRVGRPEGCGNEICCQRTNSVPGEGNLEAEVVFIGEGPGAKEDVLGRPFVGAAGTFLAEMLKSINWKREDVYITNIVKCRPPANRDPLPEEKLRCAPFLEEQLAIIDPRLIVLLGRHAMEYFLPGLKISQAHGQPKRKGGRVYLPLFHPAAALYNGAQRAVLLEDFQRIPLILEQLRSL